ADIDLAGSLNTGAGSTTLLATNQRTIGIGSALPATDYTLDSGELGRITTGDLTIGQTSALSTNGSITVGTIAPADIAGVSGAVTLSARGHSQSITFTSSVYGLPALAV